MANKRKLEKPQTSGFKTKTSKDIFLEDAESLKKQNDSLKKITKKSNNAFKVGASILVIVIAIFAFLIFNDKENPKAVSTLIQNDKGVEFTPEEEIIIDPNNFWSDLENPYPIELEEWENSSYDPTSINDSLEDNLLKYSYQYDIYSSSVLTLPSEKAGFTSNLDEFVLSDGTLNPLFNYWTTEVFSKETSLYIKRIINPAFGGWIAGQYPEYNPKENFALGDVIDMFSDSFIQENFGKEYSEYLPFYADWNADNYGGLDLLETGPRWFGEVKSTKTIFSYNTTTLQYEADVQVQITYSAWTKNKDTLTQDATLNLHLIANPELKDTPRVLISQASLVLE